MSTAFKDIIDLDRFKNIEVYNWKHAEKDVKMRIMSKDNMSKYAETACVKIPFISFFDLVYTAAFIEESSDCALTHVINSDDIQSYDVSYDTVFNVAFSNMRNDRNMRLLTFIQYCSRMAEPYYALTKHKNTLHSVYGDVEDKTDGINNILICSSATMTFGASYGFLDNTLKKVKAKFRNESYYIIPLSIHQVMYVRKKYLTEVCGRNVFDAEKDLLDTLRDMNSEYDGEQEVNVLSNNIYYCDNEDMGQMMLIK